jgi:hypothetical protein
MVFRVGIILKICVKYIIGTCGLKTLFFALCTFIRIIYGTCGLKKYGIDTFLSFFVKKLTVGHVS